MSDNYRLNGLIIHETEQDDSDIVVINDPKEASKEGFFYVPSKITYRREIPSGVEELLKSLKKNKRKKIKKSIKRCSEFEFIRAKELDKRRYEEWLDVYKKMINAKKHGNILATTEWFEKNKKTRYAVFAEKEGKVVGGIIAKVLIHSADTLSVSFSAYDKKFASFGLNEALNVELMDFARELGLKHINRGIDTNLYGYHLSVGMYLFKKSLGFYATANERYGRCLLKINNFDKFEDVIFFFSYGKERLVGNLILKKEADVDEFNADFLERLDVYSVEGNKLFKK